MSSLFARLALPRASSLILASRPVAARALCSAASIAQARLPAAAAPAAARAASPFSSMMLRAPVTSAAHTQARTPVAFASTSAPAASHGKESSHWKFERVVAIGLLVAIPTAAVYPHIAVDMALALLLPIHGHFGLHQLITDYVHPKPAIFLANNALRILTLATAASLIYFNLSDVGITHAVKALWSL
ncbi:hypothetical protein CAOG_03270 [Capsaspora owczarzaki ATCC 30864]|uniref:Succinate dehydrogenase [ubiquinone] cytochrome b small subunit n=1 Tax=Capsaspora owczarzaki (strain ATCC 30864) TaxID=595528 RepID=A0A0D2X2B5_CAPO3|nr:hypothetical protein CAOG_03270 [Capsaspora owczarzaki ATCC 30864]KJE92269.1 hypothetical protein CAOG_003270 [Capsaspora owczarzaki ATCC 30864]|eukprot:XP_004364109.1 hypothetical protein CAOG_03270 [Capsaspora owczarzaki ATCC 30864]